MSDVTGFQDLIDYLNRAQAQVLPVAGELLRDEAVDIMNDSLQEVPVLTGALAASADVGTVDINGSVAQVDFGYGNDEVDYAVIQHEGGTTPTGGQIQPKKYLERPALAHVADFESRFGQKLGPAIERI